MGPTNQANSAFHLSGVGKCVVIHENTWMMGVETIKLQTRAEYGWSVVGKSVGYRLYATLSVTQQRHCSCGMWLVVLYKCYRLSPTINSIITRAGSPIRHKRPWPTKIMWPTKIFAIFGIIY